MPLIIYMVLVTEPDRGRSLFVEGLTITILNRGNEILPRRTLIDDNHDLNRHAGIEF